MSTLSDLQAFQESLKGVWARSQGNIISHVLLAGLLFVVFRSQVPRISFPELDSKQIIDNEWYKIAKDTGLIYLLLALPFVILTIYGVMLRVGGTILCLLLAIAFPPSRAFDLRPRFINSEMLEPLALLLGRDDFTAEDLVKQFGELMSKNSDQKGKKWDPFEGAFDLLGPNAIVCLGEGSRSFGV
jgi:hypothetical protein